VLAVDTNVLVYAADADSQFHTACRDWLERQRARPDAWLAGRSASRLTGLKSSSGTKFGHSAPVNARRIERGPLKIDELASLSADSRHASASPSAARPRAEDLASLALDDLRRLRHPLAAIVEDIDLHPRPSRSAGGTTAVADSRGD